MKRTDNAKKESLGCTQEVMVPKLTPKLTHKLTSKGVLCYKLWLMQASMLLFVMLFITVSYAFHVF